MTYKIFSPKTILLILILHTIEISLFPILFKTDARPFLTHLVLIYAAFRWHWRVTVPVAFMIGILGDMTSSLPFGVVTTSLVIAALILSYAVQKIERYYFVMQLITTFIFMIGVAWLQVLFAGILGIQTPPFGYLFWVFCQGALIATVVTPFFFQFSTFWFKDQAYLRSV